MNEGMNSKKMLGLLALLALMTFLGKAQSNLVFYHANDQFNSSNFNPAFLVSQKNFTFSIFPLAGMSVGFNNQEAINDVITKFLAGNQSTNEFKGVFNSLMNENLFFLNYETNLLNLGYNSDYGFLNFRIRENILLMTDFKGDLSDFLTSPTFKILAIGQPQHFAAEGIHYREYSLGFARDIIKNKLTMGVRAKIYFGKSIMYSEVSGKIIERADTFFTQIAGPMRLSIPANPQFEDGFLKDMNMTNNLDVVNYITNAKNIGTGIDLGFTYKITPEIELSASVIDLGRIKWKNNINTLIFNDEYPFPKENIEVKLDENGVPFLTKFYEKPLADTITFKLNIDKTEFSKPLPTFFYAGLKYQLSPKINIGVVDRYTRTKGMNYNSFSLTASYEVNKKLSLISGYSVLGSSFSNIPLAVIYQGDSGQTYIGTDNVLSFLPSAGFSGISFGTCFYLFRGKTKYSESEYLPFYQVRKSKRAKKIR